MLMLSSSNNSLSLYTQQYLCGSLIMFAVCGKIFTLHSCSVFRTNMPFISGSHFPKLKPLLLIFWSFCWDCAGTSTDAVCRHCRAATWSLKSL